MPCKEGLTADALLSYIADVFIRCGVNNDKFIAMSFDGASAIKSLAEKLKNCYGQQVSYIRCRDEHGLESESDWSQSMAYFVGVELELESVFANL